MKLESLNIQDSINGAKPRVCPEYIVYAPPSGHPVECPSFVSAIMGAEVMSGRSPGGTFGVYRLVGFAYKPVERSEFVTTEGAETQAPKLIEARAGDG